MGPTVTTLNKNSLTHKLCLPIYIDGIGHQRLEPTSLLFQQAYVTSNLQELQHPLQLYRGIKQKTCYKTMTLTKCNAQLCSCTQLIRRDFLKTKSSDFFFHICYLSINFCTVVYLTCHIFSSLNPKRAGLSGFRPPPPKISETSDVGY